MSKIKLSESFVIDRVKLALMEDLYPDGDITSDLLKKDKINVGKITSAVYSPRLKKNIALAMVSIEHSEIGNKFQATTNEGTFNCVIVEKPFYDPKKKIASS